MLLLVNWQSFHRLVHQQELEECWPLVLYLSAGWSSTAHRVGIELPEKWSHTRAGNIPERQYGTKEFQNFIIRQISRAEEPLGALVFIMFDSLSWLKRSNDLALIQNISSIPFFEGKRRVLQSRLSLSQRKARGRNPYRRSQFKQAPHPGRSTGIQFE